MCPAMFKATKGRFILKYSLGPQTPIILGNTLCLIPYGKYYWTILENELVQATA